MNKVRMVEVLPRALPLLAGLLYLSVAAPRAHADSLLFWDFENATSAGDISTSVGAPGASGISGFASQTGGGPAEYFGPGLGLVLLTRSFGTYHPYIEFTVTRPMVLTDVTFDHIHNHNFGEPTNPGYDAQLQIDTGSGYQDIGAALRLSGLFTVPPYDGTQSGYVTGSSIALNVAVNPGTYRLRWDSRNLNPVYDYGSDSWIYPTDTWSEYFALNNLSLNGPATYAWSGILQPVNADGSSIFKLGSTVPVKFQLTGASAAITTLVANLYVAKISNNVVGLEAEVVSSNPASTGSLFRYDATSGQYIYNWGTKGLTAGSYQLRVDLGDGVSHTVIVSLK